MNRFALVLCGLLLGLPVTAQAPKQGPDNRELLQRLAQGDRKAVPALVKQGEAVVPELAKLLKTAQREEKGLIVHVVAEIARQVGPRAKEAVPALCEALSLSDKAAASAAARALGAIGPDAVPELVKALKAVEDQPQALYPVRALAYMGSKGKDGVPAVLATLKTTIDAQVRMACIESLGAAGAAGKVAVAELLNIAETDQKASYYKATLIMTLGNIGPDAKAAVPFLLTTMKEAREPHFRIHAMEALTRIDPGSKELAGSFAKMIENPDLPRVMILEGLAKGGPLGKELLKAIEEFLRDKDSRVRLQAAAVLAKTKPNHPAVVSILIESTQERDPKMRRLAVEVIGNVRPDDEAVLEALNQRLEDNDPEVRKAVAAALAKFKKK